MSLNPKKNCSTTLPITAIDPDSSVSRPLTLPVNTTQMQVAHKENSSGFMLLSVKHQTKKNKNAHFGLLVNKQPGHFEDYYDGPCIGKSSLPNMSYRSNKRNSYELGRQFESTASLDAEEYDDEDEDELDPNSEPNDIVLPTEVTATEITKPPSILPLQTNVFNLVNTKYMHAVGTGQMNTAQSFDSIPPVSIANIHNGLGGIRQHPPTIGWPSVVTQSTCSLHETTGAENTASFPNFQINAPSSTVTALAMQQLRSETSVSELENALHPAHIDQQAVPACTTKSQGIVNIKKNGNDEKPTELSATYIVSNDQLPINSHKPSLIPSSTQSTHHIEQVRSASDAPNISSQIFSSLNPPIQTASRFRKARIRETVEQWNSNRVSFHDCRLKAVPDWVSDLQAKTPSYFNHPTAQHSRCLYCFVPGSYGQHCRFKDHRKILPPIQSNSIALQNKQESLSSGIGILKAAGAVYQVSALQGFNLDSLFSSWHAGRRSSQKISQEQMNLYGLSKHLSKTKGKPGDIKHQSNLINEQIGIIADHVQVAEAVIYTAGHNSSELTDAMESEQAPTMAFYPCHYSKAPEVLSASMVAPSSQLDSSNTEAHTCTDPSTEYLRRLADFNRQGSTLGNEPCIDDKDGTKFCFAGGVQTNPIIDQNDNSEGQAEIDEKRIHKIQHYAPPTSPAFSVKTNSNALTGDEFFRTKSSNDESWLTSRQNEIFEKYTTPFMDINKLLCEGDTLRKRAATARIVGTRGAVVSLATSLPHSPDSELQSAFSQPTDLHSTAETSRGTLVARQYSTYMDAFLAMQTSARSDNGMDLGTTVNGCPNTNYANGERASSMGPPSKLPDHPGHASILTSTSEVGISGGPDVFPPVGNYPQQSSVPIKDPLETRMPTSMDMIRLAIMTTLNEELSQLNAENAALREGLQKMHHENLMLRGYHRAFQALQPYVASNIWDQLDVQVQLDAFQQSLPQQQQQVPAQQHQPQTQQSMASLVQNGCHTSTTVGNLSPNRALSPPNPPTHVDSSVHTSGPFHQSPLSRSPQVELSNNLPTKKTPLEVPPMPDLCANLQSSMQHKNN